MNNDFMNLFMNKQSKEDSFLKAAQELFNIYESFMQAGFSKDQAFYLTSEILKGGLKYYGKN
jgi:hypothetical protein